MKTNFEAYKHSRMRIMNVLHQRLTWSL